MSPHTAPTLPPALREELYPFASHWFTTPSGAQMHYLDEAAACAAHASGEPLPTTQGHRPALSGRPRPTAQPAPSGEAVLMLHGNPTWSIYYAELVKAVSPHLRCIVPDHIGMGLSEKPSGYDYRLKTRIDDIAALVTALGLQRVHLVVHDWGGAIGFGFAARHPELIGRLVILNTAAFRSKRMPARIALCKVPLVGPAIVRGLNGFAWPALSMSMVRRALSRAERHALIFPYDSWANRVAVSAFVRDIPRNAAHPSWETLGEVEAGLAQFQKNPALILWGGGDFCFDQDFYLEWRRRMPQAEAHFFGDAGHYVLFDADWQTIPKIREFLTRPD